MRCHLHRVIYKVSRKYPFMYAPAILSLAAQYDKAVPECCKAENPEECFQTKVVILCSSVNLDRA